MDQGRFLVDKILEREKIRILLMIESYQQRIAVLPNGSLKVRELNGNKYCYLSFREGRKVVTKYAGSIENLACLEAQIRERKYWQMALKKLKEEYKRILKMEKVK